MSAYAGVSEDAPLFGGLVRRHRGRIGLTQRELADLSTISVRAIRDLEQGKATRPRHATVRLIADGLRLGPRARAELEAAAHQGQGSWALKAAYDAAPPAPPTALQSLVGRESEIAVITGELSSGAERLVNVVGLSGVGKTRIALEVAGRLHTGGGLPVLWSAFRDAAAEYRLPSGVEGLAAVVAGCAGEIFGPPDTRRSAPETADRPAERDDTAALAELVANRPALLVVDGAGVDEPRVDRLVRLLRDCPELVVLVTSERPYGIPGERPFLLGPLEPPGSQDESDPETLGRVPAVRFFLGQLQRIRPEYRLSVSDVPTVSDICRRLDGLPSALRAAASWLVVYDLDTLRHCLESDPASLLNHFAGADDSTRFQDTLRRRVGHLPPEGRSLLIALCDGGGEFGLDDVVSLTGRSLPDCGRMVRDLLLSGMAHPSYQCGRSRFQVFNLVRALRPAFGLHRAPGTALTAGRPAVSGAPAAGVPEELPPAAPHEVFDDFHVQAGKSLGSAESIT
ncbi:helix-turn-helix domain-containing protein [Streptomyces sp. AK02-01A]|uniref:helix-turn-helix domain-containing protein n=1 Tax=Streptomyces sp. AK02-01A TaxID=3028648 RepID=UPI0029A8B13B|nr:helix-turn-helix domain-containing protein [Streptomyces sp. AK02-01A]MDX3852318.1 helix-turn-helix domain-containing protein [Streptomyces sp. AK02-01A]